MKDFYIMYWTIGGSQASFKKSFYNFFIDTYIS